MTGVVVSKLSMTDSRILRRRSSPVALKIVYVYIY